MYSVVNCIPKPSVPSLQMKKKNWTGLHGIKATSSLHCVSFHHPAGEDYINFHGPPPGSQTVLFPAGTGNGAVMNAPLTILNDSIVEGPETIVLMSFIPAGVKASFAPGQDNVTILIWDNEGKY